ncbi:hypothetical protein FRB94_010788 [Tulasnella sp. JGI-2019a]|nr:hypothetical protein FRB94_010788 [Tulasnella sp. JGI-2019a]
MEDQLEASASSVPKSSLTNPQEDADRIRLKRLAKLQSAQQSPSSSSPPTPPPPAPTPPKKAKVIPPPSRPQDRPVIFQSPRPVAKSSAPPKFDFATWEPEAITQVLRVTLNREQAVQSNGQIVWLEEVAAEVASQDPSLRLSSELADQLVMSRLESGSATQTSFEYLTGCWRRLRAMKTTFSRRGYNPFDLAQGMAVIDKLHGLIVSYAGLSLQDPSMFYQPPGKIVGPKELLPSLMGLATSSPLTYLSSSSTVSETLESSDVEPFLADLAARFDGDGLDEILGGVFKELIQLVSMDRQGLMSTDVESSWRSALAAMEGLVAVKPIAAMMTRVPQWNPHGLTSSFIEFLSLLGPPARLSVFARDWPQIAQTYFFEPEKRSQSDIDGSNTNLRSTLHILQQSLFTIFNSAVRAGAPPREAVLDYFATALNLNLKRGGMQVDRAQVASDGYMINLQVTLLRLAEPFIDAKFTKIDKVDPLYLIHSSRLDTIDETRINATVEDVKALTDEVKAVSSAPSAPNFITEIFYLTAAFNHYGLVRTLGFYNELERHLDDIDKYLERIESDTSYIGTPMEAQARAAVEKIKGDKTKLNMELFAYRVQILDPDLIFRMIGFTIFLMTWLIRLADPAKQYPAQQVALPLPREVSPALKTLPEYFFEDIVEFYLFLVRHTPGSMDLAGKKELVEFILTFMSSTWYIKNPYLKSKLVQILFYGILPYGRDKMGVMGPILNSHPTALQHLIPILMSFYVEVEQTGAHSQFYDKFDTRRNIAYILKAIWTNPDHREALNREVRVNMANFVRFANLLMNDCTYLLDESLSKLSEIHAIQIEMASESWATRPLQERKDREKALQGAEQQATSYITLGKSMIDLLKTFTAEAKAPFTTAEIVDRLAAMLNYNLDALVGPKCSNLNVKNMDKYRFNPRQLLSDIIAVYLNLSDQQEFVRAVAGEGRSYKKSLFERAGSIATKWSLKSSTEVEQLMMFVTKVEETKLLIDVEDDLGEIPDDFLDPLMYTLMRDPVKLPSSKTTIDRSTIKAHLLSDSHDPFNRSPLKIEDVTPDTELKEKIDTWLVEKRSKGMVVDAPEVTMPMEIDD